MKRVVILSILLSVVLISGCTQDGSQQGASSQDSRLDYIKLSDSDISSFRGEPIESTSSTKDRPDYKMIIYRYKWNSDEYETVSLQVQVSEYNTLETMNKDFDDIVKVKKDAYDRDVSKTIFKELSENIGIGDKSILTGGLDYDNYEIVFVKDKYMVTISSSADTERDEILGLANIIEDKI